MRKWNKKAGLGVVIITALTMVGWFFLWIGIDYATGLGDGILNNSIEDSNAIPYNWSEQYGTFQGTRTNMNRIIMYMGLIIIPIAGMGSAIKEKVSDLFR